MVKPLHDGIDDTEGIFLTLLCQVEVDHGGFLVGVSEVFLDDPDIDACLEEMGCVGMALMPSSELCRVTLGTRLVFWVRVLFSSA
jgi:hypothetical protein